MEELNLVKILKDCPQGTKLYFIDWGEVELVSVGNTNDRFPITVKYKNNELESFTQNGHLYSGYPDAECVLFPSKENRDWSTFKISVEKFNILALKPFDKVLVRDADNKLWTCGLFSHYSINASFYKFKCVGCIYIQCIPYNEETEHLLGTCKMPPEKYINW